MTPTAKRDKISKKRFIYKGGFKVFRESETSKDSEPLRKTDGFCCTWAAAVLNAEPDILPKKIPLKNNTLRQQFQVSVGGSEIRLTFSNEYSETLDPPKSALELKSVHIAKLLKMGEPDIDLSTDTVVTFGSKSRVSIPAGQRVTSDPIAFPTDSLGFFAVTVRFGDIPDFPACHREADCSSWLVNGDRTAENFVPDEYLWSYFSLCSADVLTKPGVSALVCFGDSITDGAVSDFNGFDAWPNLLSQCIQSDPKTNNVSVVNTAIAGNAIFGGWGTPAKDRFRRDVLETAGVSRAIILIGTNDIPGAQSDISESMIDQYKAMIDACHMCGIKIYAGTVTPFGKNDWWTSELHESIRSRINSWMMSKESGFDGFIDFASAVCNPGDPTVLRADCDSGDGLHPSPAGHKAMGEMASSEIKKILLQL